MSSLTNTPTSSPTQALPYISLLGVLWGTNLVVARFGVSQFNAVLFVGLRLALASVGFFLIYFISPRRHWPKERRLWRHAVLLGVLGTAAPMTAIISSLQYQSSGVTAILITASPAIIVLLAHFLLPDERLNRFKGTGVALALGGSLLIVLRGESGLPDMTTANPLGYALVFFALLCESSGAIYVRTYMRDLNAFDVTNVRLLAASLVVLPAALLTTGADFSHVNMEGLLSLGYAAFGGALTGQLLAFYITRQFGATAFSMTSYVIPVAAAVAGVLFLDETITTGMITGLFLIATGIMLINKHR